MPIPDKVTARRKEITALLDQLIQRMDYDKAVLAQIQAELVGIDFVTGAYEESPQKRRPRAARRDLRAMVREALLHAGAAGCMATDLARNLGMTPGQTQTVLAYWAAQGGAHYDRGRWHAGARSQPLERAAE